MGVVVSIRPIDLGSEFQARMKSGSFELPSECSHNADLFESLLGAMVRVIPGIREMSAVDLRITAEALAFVVRPDLLRTHTFPSTVYSRGYKPPKKLHAGKPLRYRRPPEELTEGFIFPMEKLRSEPPAVYEVYTAIEFGRSMAGAREVAEGFKAAVSFGETFSLADAMSHIADPLCFSDYTYTPEILAQYYKALQYDLDTI